MLAGAMLAGAISSTATAADHKVTIKGFKFSAATLTVTVGDTVTFTNADGAPHTATAKDKSFDTKTLKPGASKTITINKAGTFAYFCRIHPSMKAKIVATKAAAAGDNSADAKLAAAKASADKAAADQIAAAKAAADQAAKDQVATAKAAADKATANKQAASKAAADKAAAENSATKKIAAYKAAAEKRAAAQIAAYKAKLAKETAAKIAAYNQGAAAQPSYQASSAKKVWMKKSTNRFVEENGDITSWAGTTYAACEKRCIETDRCIFLEFYRPEKKCGLFSFKPKQKSGKKADVAVKIWRSKSTY